MDVEITLEPSDRGYAGTGTLDCTDAVGSDCEQSFEIDVRPESTFGEQDLDVDLDECEMDAGFLSGEIGCGNPDDVWWDGGDLIEGEWGDCDVELLRE